MVAGHEETIIVAPNPRRIIKTSTIIEREFYEAIQATPFKDLVPQFFPSTDKLELENLLAPFHGLWHDLHVMDLKYPI